MRIALAQLNYHIGNFESNFLKIKAAIDQARIQKADLVVFSELAICGYPPRDFLEFDDFINQCWKTVERIAAESKDLAVFVGCPTKNPDPHGKDLFNSAIFIENGKVTAQSHKALLPTYDVFDEDRYFEPCHDFHCVEFRGKKIAVTVCEDIWNVGNDNPLYTLCPMDELIKEKPDFMINISASPFDYDHQQLRIEVIRANVLRYGIPMFYCNHVGAQTELIFDGGSIIMKANGELHDVMPVFEESLKVYELEEVFSNQKSEIRSQKSEKVELIYSALVLGIKDYFQKLGFKKAILGLSGGVDSALVLVLACEALGKENVHALLMPSPFSSKHSVDDALALVKNIGCSHDIIQIEKAYDVYLETLKPFFNDKPFDVTEENLQARIRGNLLMAYTNKFGFILLNTTNKSEMAVGYGTLYGDLAGGLSVLGDVYKTEVYELCDYINRAVGGDANRRIIPENIIAKAPSAELRPNQKDSDSLPEYNILDPLLFQYVEKRKGPKELAEMGFAKSLIARVLKLVNTNEYKRHQTAPILRVSPKAFGVGRRMPIVGKYMS